MIVWSGNGFLVPVIVFGCLVVAELATETAFRDDSYYQEHGWPMGLGFAVSGFVTAAYARRLRAPRPRFMVDEETGERVLVGEEGHTFLFIPVRYWPHLLLAIGAVTSVVMSSSVTTP